MKRGVHDLVACETPLRVSNADVANFTAPAFIECDGKAIGRKRAERDPFCSSRNSAELFSNELYGLLYLEPADVCAGESISALIGGNGDLCETKNTRGLVLSSISYQARGTGSRTDEAQFSGNLAGQYSNIFKAGHDGRRFPKKIYCDSGIFVRRIELAQQPVDPIVIHVKANTAGPNHSSTKPAAA